MKENIVELLKEYNVEIDQSVIDSGVSLEFTEYGNLNKAMLNIHINNKCRCSDSACKINNITITKDDSETAPVFITVDINMLIKKPEGIVIYGETSSEYGIVRYLSTNETPIHLSIGKLHDKDVLMIITNNLFNKGE